MSSYLDFSVERKTDKGWKQIYSTDYDDDIEVVSPYVLKPVFWDTDCFQKFADFEDELTLETLCMHGIKIERVPNPEDDDSYSAQWNKETYNSKSYPYKYKPFIFTSLALYFPGTGSDKKQALIEQFKLLCKSERKFVDTLIGVSIEGIDKHLDVLIDYLHLKAGKTCKDVSDYQVLKDQILRKGTIKDDLDKFDDLIEHQGEYYMLVSTPYVAITLVRDYPVFKDEVLAKDVLTGRYGLVQYQDDTGKTVRQYTLGDAKISTKEDLARLAKEVEDSISNAEKANSVDNLVKDRIRDFLDDAKDSDLETELGQKLAEYTDDTESTFTDDYIEDCKVQLEELRVLIRLVGDNGRLIWNID